MRNPFDHPMSHAVHRCLHAQAERAVALSQAVVDFQRDQADAADKLVHDQAMANTKAAMDAWHAGARMVIDAHRDAVAAMPPSAAEA